MTQDELSDIVIRIREARDTGSADKNDPKIEEKMFEAYSRGDRIGYIIVDRFLQPNFQEANDEFYVDRTVIPPKPKPNLSFISIYDAYQGNNISGVLIEHAHQYYKTHHGTALHSGEANTPSAIRVWEKLVEKGKAYEYMLNGKRRWSMY